MKKLAIVGVSGLVGQTVLKVLKEEFFASPLISNYISIKDEMHRFLEQIVNILSE